MGAKGVVLSFMVFLFLFLVQMRAREKSWRGDAKRFNRLVASAGAARVEMVELLGRNLDPLTAGEGGGLLRTGLEEAFRGPSLAAEVGRQVAAEMKCRVPAAGLDVAVPTCVSSLPHFRPQQHTPGVIPDAAGAVLDALLKGFPRKSYCPAPPQPLGASLLGPPPVVGVPSSRC